MATPSSGPAKANTISTQRLAAIAAAEARLAGKPNPNTPEARRAARPPPPPWEPTEKGDKERKLEFTRLLDRGIVRDNGYRQAAECVETLIKISTNIIDNISEPKFRNLRATNNGLKNKILLIKGGEDFLIALGFRTTTVDFEKHYVFEPTQRRMYELKLGREVLSEQLGLLQSRLSSSTPINAKDEESARKAAALRASEEDRMRVKERVAREKIAREAREKMAREAAEAEALRLAQEEANPPPAQEEEVMPGGMRLGGEQDAAPSATATASSNDAQSGIPTPPATAIAAPETESTEGSTATPRTEEATETEAERKRRKAARLAERDRRDMEAYKSVLGGMKVGTVSSSSFDSIHGSMVGGARGGSSGRAGRDYRPGPPKRSPSFTGEGNVLGGGSQAGPTDGAADACQGDVMDRGQKQSPSSDEGQTQ